MKAIFKIYLANSNLQHLVVEQLIWFIMTTTLVLTQTRLVNLDLFWVPPEPSSSSGTGTRPGGWEPLR